MIFTSMVYAIFFLTVAVIFYIIPRKFQWVWILLSSIFFYMYSHPAYIAVATFIILVTYVAALQIENNPANNKGKHFYIWAIFANIGILVFYKYTNFFTTTAFEITNFTSKHFFHSDSILKNNLLITAIAPLGISYISFQAIGYLVEIKRGNQQAEKNPGHLAAFLLFFPKILSGPVERAHHFLPQLKQAKSLNYESISSGVKLIIWGLFKKLVIADRLSIYVNAVLGNAEHHSGITLVVAVFFYVFQVYTDFSGYTDMALGFAKILDFDLTQNFNRPLLSKSVTDFWRKWHISLSTWFADYVYNPIAIAKRDWGKWSVVYSFLISFMLLGFWHGANWTFIIFGLLQGLILTIEFFTRKTRKNIRKKIPAFANNTGGMIFTFAYFAFSLIFFRANNLNEALMIIKRIFSSTGTLYIENPSMILFSLLGIIYLVLVESKKEYFDSLFTLSNNKKEYVRILYYCFLLIIILMAGVFDGGQFIYFQF